MSAALRAVAVAVAVLLAVPARADEPVVDAKEQAKELAKEGAELFRAGNRRAAVAKFEEAYAVYPNPVLLYNLGKAYAGLSDDAKAHRALTRFLRETEADDFDVDRRTEVEMLLTELDKKVGIATITAPKFAGATIEIDGAAIGTAPLADPVALDPGVHEITARRGKVLVARKRVSLAAATRPEIELVRVEDDLEKIFVTREVESRPVYKRWWFWTAVGAAAVSTATVLIVTNPRRVNEVEDPPLGSFEIDDFGQ